MLTLAMLLDDAARKRPDREAIVAGSTRLTYGELDARACQVANGLRARGIGPGDRVALSCPNVAYFPIAYYGILKAGGTVVPLNVLLKGPEIAYHLQDSEAKAYLCFEGTEELPMARMGHAGFQATDGCEQFVVMTADPAGPSPISGAVTLSELMRDLAPTFETVVRQPDDTAVILYTSGTTGQPKGAKLTQSNMVLNAFISRDLAHAVVDGRELQVALVGLPLFHSFGQTVQMNAGVLQKDTLVLVPRFEPGPVLDLMVREKVTMFAGVPTMYWGLLNEAREQGTDTSAIAENLAVCTSGGAAMPVELLRAFEDTFGVTILEGYGLSETSPVATFNHGNLPRKVGSIGVPIWGTEVRVVDDEGGDVDVDEVGEIIIRGHNIMKGYVNRPDATAETIRDGGWLHTGDLGRIDEDGYLYITGRLKDMIIRGGFNVYPREIEEVLNEHEAVSLAAVVGVPDEESGEEIKAFIVREAGAEVAEDEIIEWCKERMAAYKYPRMVEFRDSLPMNATGKILKRKLRAEEEEEKAGREKVEAAKGAAG